MKNYSKICLFRLDLQLNIWIAFLINYGINIFKINSNFYFEIKYRKKSGASGSRARVERLWISNADRYTKAPMWIKKNFTYIKYSFETESYDPCYYEQGHLDKNNGTKYFENANPILFWMVLFWVNFCKNWLIKKIIVVLKQILNKALIFFLQYFVLKKSSIRCKFQNLRTLMCHEQLEKNFFWILPNNWFISWKSYFSQP